VGNLDSVLQESPSLESIRFFESADYIVNNEDQDDASNGGRGDDRIGAWCTMEEDLRIFQQKYPAVQIQLHDWWWGT
jgi:hypothetical protein